MKKDSILITLDNAKKSHQKWVDNALFLIQGMPLEKDKVPVDSTKCIFGKWYYSQGQALNQIPGFKEIEDFHNKLHHKYHEIFSLLFDEKTMKKPSFLEKLFGLSQKVEKEKRELAMEKYEQLSHYSEHIVTLLTRLEKIISVMTDEQLARYTEKT